MHHRFVLAGSVVVFALAGCGGGSSTAVDAASSDGPALADAPGNDANLGDVVLAKSDGPTAPPDVSPAHDANDTAGAKADLLAADAVPTDLRRADAVPTDLRTADLKLIPDQAAADAPAPDAPANDAQVADRFGVDAFVPDGPRSEASAADRPAGETGSDAGCTGWTTLQRISPAEAADLIATSDPIVINVHIPYEGDIPGTDTSIPYNDVDAIDAYLNGDPCADVLLVCLSGGMSKTAGDELIRRGYLRIRDLKGGMIAWEGAGYPLLKDGGP